MNLVASLIWAWELAEAEGTRGYRAGFAGMAQSSNPHVPGTMVWRCWNTGWLKGKKDRGGDECQS